MARVECPSCRGDVVAGHRFCGRCGADLSVEHRQALSPSAAPTASPAEILPTGAQAGETSDSGRWARSDVRFSPGTIIADRYRIVAMLGRGGMGEVYRADDLTLGRPVALKFLPETVERDPGRLGRFLNEVRTAIEVSHPNVCRVHDINQYGSHYYISMEFVDGDDLAALLRRIGRLPPDKAVEIARQLCAGLSAAHGAGILHRDLKPANVMIDGRGKVKITDFGLAALASDLGGDELRAGTPAYMAPEQLSGEQVSIASDIYALGLVLYELFTGRRAFDGVTPAEMLRQRESAPTSPSSILRDMDPAVERVILRCLERDPRERPRSALAVAVALPGGDPLAAALAAGETPAPELVAEAGAAGGLRPSVAIVLLVVVLAALAALIAFSERFTLVARADLPKSAEVLADKAREIIRNAGYEEPPRDSLYAFDVNQAYYEHVRGLEPADDRWNVAASPQPAMIMFGYRQEPELILFESPGSVGEWMERVSSPLPGAVRVLLDPLGRLLWLEVVPPEHEADTGEATVDPDWDLLLAAAGLDPAALDDAKPAWLPPKAADRRRAWAGVYPDAPDVSIRVEAAAYRGRPVYFRIIEPWTRPREVPPQPASFWARAGAIVGTVWFLIVLISSVIVAWRNVRLGRGDRRTALRLAFALAAIRFLWILDAHHVPSAYEVEILRSHLAWSMFRFALVYVFYLALEPYARRIWPRMLTSWVRIFDGRFRDPLVGRDLLIGAVFGVGFALTKWMVFWTAELARFPGYGLSIELWGHESLRGFLGAVASLFGVESTSILDNFIGMMLIVIVRVLVRRTWLTVAVVTPLTLVLFNPGHGHPAPFIVFGLICMAGYWLVLLRFGLLPLMIGMALADAFNSLPLTFDLTAWWSGSTWLVLTLCLGITVWGFWTALAGQPIFRDQLLEKG